MSLDSISNKEFNEDGWLRILFLINDTQIWVNEMAKSVIFLLPIEDRKKLFRKTFYITVSSLAHILERHYYKIQRFPNAGKFTINIPEILSYLRDCFHHPCIPIPGTLNTHRVIDTGRVIGIDQNGNNTTLITIVSDGGGKIVTAFPGVIAKNRNDK